MKIIFKVLFVIGYMSSTCCASKSHNYTDVSQTQSFNVYIIVSGEASFYNVGKTTTCGRTYTNKDYVAAIARNYFTNSTNMCGRQAQVYDEYSRLSVVVTIVDVCAKCLAGDIVLSTSAFEQLRSTARGSCNVEWYFL